MARSKVVPSQKISIIDSPTVKHPTLEMAAFCTGLRSLFYKGNDWIEETLSGYQYRLFSRPQLGREPDFIVPCLWNGMESNKSIYILEGDKRSKSQDKTYAPIEAYGYITKSFHKMTLTQLEAEVNLCEERDIKYFVEDYYLRINVNKFMEVFIRPARVREVLHTFQSYMYERSCRTTNKIRQTYVDIETFREYMYTQRICQFYLRDVKGETFLSTFNLSSELD